MARKTGRWVGLVLIGTFCFLAKTEGQRATQENTRSAPTPVPAPTARKVLDQYCVTCHSERLHTAGLNLSAVNVDDIGGRADVWEKIVKKVSTGEMPPVRAPRPDQAVMNAFVSSIESALDNAAAVKPNPGQVPIHRLNRTEYANAVHDLLALDVDGRALLIADDVDQQGFDNIAGVLSVSPALLERYMSSARMISRVAIGDSTIVPVFETYDVPKEFAQDDQASEDLPFGSAGGIAVRHTFPVDGEYVIKIRLRRQLYGYILGLARPHKIEIRLDSKRVTTFTVGGDAPGIPAPASFAGNVTTVDPKWDLYMHEADAPLEFRFRAEAGTRVIGVSFIRELSEPEGVLQPPETGFGLAVNEQYYGNPAVDSVSIGGPFKVNGPGDTPGRRRILICTPNGAAQEQLCARNILSVLAKRAYRRPVIESEMQTLLAFYNAGRKQGTFETGIQFGLERILVDPNFLFRIERSPLKAAPGAVYPLSDLELASRLSFFLWSSIPDDELLDAAITGKLRNPGFLDRQIARMSADPRSRALVDNFASQWLDLRKIRDAAPDPDVFPEFDDNLRQAFLTETQLFLESEMRADRSIVDLLTANYTFVNERLARHYQIPNVYGSHFRRVTVTGNERGGLLGEGSVLMLTSYPNRTSPVLRGKWLLDNILGMPPPPPPPDVPGLKDTGENGKVSSVRERMEEHRKNPACAVCHVRMDPLGFSLENFDAIGKWRTTSDGLPVNASASLPDGTQFEGIEGLRKLLLEHREQFVGSFTEKLLTYALGREVEYYDLPAVRKIVRDATGDGSKWSAIIAGVVRSTPFQMSIVKNAESGTQGSEQQTAKVRRSGNVHQ